MDSHKKTCKNPACNKPFEAKRRNQEYCDANCKKKANNEVAANERKIIKEIDYTLKRNRRILEFLHNAGKTIINDDELKFNGFNYTRLTGLSLDSKGQYSIPQFYNYTLEKINTNQYKINKL